MNAYRLDAHFWRARAALWKAAAKEYRRRHALQSEFADGWYQAYRRAHRLDEPNQPEATIADVWRWLRSLLTKSGEPK